MSFDHYATSFDASQFQTYPSDFSPVVSLFDNLEDFGTDFTSESAASPISPISPVLSASSYGYPVTDGWVSWDQTESSPEPEGLFKTNNPFDGSLLTQPCLSPAVNPMDLAMPTVLGSEGLHSQPPLFQSSMLPTLPSQQPTALIKQEPLGDDDAAKRHPSRSLKRKSSTPSPDDGPLPTPKRSSPPPTTARRGSKDNKDAGPKKTAHNMIEKRYRTNLNDKISQLRDAVPSLRAVAQRMEHPATYDDANRDEYADDVNNGLSHAAKLNKATILAKATEYITQLESRNHGLEAENNALRSRMEAMEMLLMSRGGGVAGMPVWN
ncbi:helix-loop-helix DNA-binding domain-containing protein [Podospora australis]|uniref:Helix-loop-helix DNA-binding domain-containing protein n=1 Tax=Podospora australis TaxID=1536484 RepID=A0AAN7AEU4_9PEZI|nr:helix-loop-helix DNA-binding domain-containing protein [Podospora australis]